MKELITDNLEQFVLENKKVIVQYGASWCGVCKIMKPKFSALAQSNEEIVFLYVDAEKFPNTRKLAVVDNLPTFAGFALGKLVKQTTGSRDQAIMEVINEIASY